MKREEILFYLTNGKIYVYLLGSGREFTRSSDTSLFFKWGEISSVDKCATEVSKIVGKMNFGLYYLRPNVTVLYNDVCACDLKHLYRSALAPFGANKVSFLPLTKLVKRIKESDNIVVADGDCYTLINRREKCSSLKNIEFEPIIIGDVDDKNVHFSDKEIIWKTFKSHFTKEKNYGMMDVGDDDV